MLRPASDRDIPALFAVRTSVRENHLTLSELAERGVSPASVEASLGDEKTRTWVVEKEDAVVGFSMADARTGTVFALFVSPEAEGRGFGRALLDAAEEWLFAQGWEMIWLNTGEDPANRAHSFYQRAGWRLAGPADHGDVRYEKQRR